MSSVEIDLSVHKDFVPGLLSDVFSDTRAHVLLSFSPEWKDDFLSLFAADDNPHHTFLRIDATTCEQDDLARVEKFLLQSTSLYGHGRNIVLFDHADKASDFWSKAFCEFSELIAKDELFQDGRLVFITDEPVLGLRDLSAFANSEYPGVVHIDFV